MHNHVTQLNITRITRQLESSQTRIAVYVEFMDVLVHRVSTCVGINPCSNVANCRMSLSFMKGRHGYLFVL